MSQEPDREEEPDWRRPDTYAYTETLTRIGWAWEFLRRNPAFQADLGSRPSQSSKEVSERSDLKRWGICFAESAARAVSKAKLFWDPQQCAHVLPLTLGPSAYTELLTLKTVSPIATLNSAQGRHILFCEGAWHLQVWARLEPQIDDRRILTDAVLSTSTFMPRLRSLACFNDLLCAGHLLGRYFPPEPRQYRMTAVLRCLDAILKGAAHRDIAIALHGRKRVDTDWGDPREHLRDTVRRALGRGRSLMNGGYLKLLR